MTLHRIYHRFSTNTTPSWERAQPFRLLCHNGEINTIQGNVNWMRARQSRIGWPDDTLIAPVVDASGSDSGMLDNALELLVRGGRDVRHGLAMLVPEAWEANTELDEQVRGFYRYHSALVEPWDGPAGIVFTDGQWSGPLDRNGLRPPSYTRSSTTVSLSAPLRWGRSRSPRARRVRRGRLGPGRRSPSTPARRTCRRTGRSSASLPSGVRTGPGCARACGGKRPGAIEAARDRAPAAPGRERYTREELSLVLRPLASHGHEPTSSMGDDTALPPLAGRARPVFGYVRQRFAQVTNPAIDHLRERHVMSLRTLLGAREPLLSEVPEAAHVVELESFFLYPTALAGLPLTPLAAAFHEDEGLEAACARLGDEAQAAVEGGAELLLVTIRAPAGAGADPGAARDRLRPTDSSPRACARARRESSRATAARTPTATLLGYGATRLPTLAMRPSRPGPADSSAATSLNASAARSGTRRGRRLRDSKWASRRRELSRRPDLRALAGARGVDTCFVGTLRASRRRGFASRARGARTAARR